MPGGHRGRRRRRDGRLRRGIAVAHVVAAPETLESDVADAVRGRLNSLLPPFKVPAEIGMVHALPRTATGKIQRFKLRARPTEIRS